MNTMSGNQLRKFLEDRFGEIIIRGGVPMVYDHGQTPMRIYVGDGKTFKERLESICAMAGLERPDQARQR